MVNGFKAMDSRRLKNLYVKDRFEEVFGEPCTLGTYYDQRRLWSETATGKKLLQQNIAITSGQTPAGSWSVFWCGSTL